MDLSESAVNSATVPSLDLAALVSACVERNIPAISPWRDLIAPHGAAAARRIITDAGLTVAGLCRGGLFTAPTEQSRHAAIEDNLRAIDEAHDLGAPALVLVSGPIIERDPAGSRSMIRTGIESILPHARAAGVALAIEPLHPMMAASRSAVTSLREANDLREAIGEPEVGVVVDVYHVWWEHDLIDQISRAAGHIAGLHVSDWVTPIHNELSSRGMMGDGCIDIPGIRARVRSVGYDGYVEAEVLSEAWWSVPPGEVLDVVRSRFITAC